MIKKVSCVGKTNEKRKIKISKKENNFIVNLIGMLKSVVNEIMKRHIIILMIFIVLTYIIFGSYILTLITENAFLLIIFIASFAILYVPWWILLGCLTIIYLATIFKKSKLLCLFIIVLVSYITSVLIFDYTHVKYDLSEIYDKDLGQFVYDDKIYYFADPEIIWIDTFLFNFNRNSINSMNVDGSDNKFLCRTLKNTTKEIVMIKDDELYFIDDINNYYKVNLSNCKQTRLLDLDVDVDYFFGPMYDDKSIYFKDTSRIIKFDLEKGKTEDYVEDFHMIYPLIDYKSLDIYEISFDNSSGGTGRQHIFKNGEKIFDFTDESINEELLLLTDKYLYFVIDYVVYRMDLSNYKIIEEIGSIDNTFTYQFATRYDNYFVKDGKLYLYNENENKFEVLVDEEIDFLEGLLNVSYYENKVLFWDEIGNLLLYDTKTKQYRVFSDAKYNYDVVKKELYIITKDKDEKKLDIEKIK